MRALSILILLLVYTGIAQAVDFVAHHGAQSTFYTYMNDAERHDYSIDYAMSIDYLTSNHPLLSMPRKEQPDFSEIRWSSTSTFPAAKASLVRIGRVLDSEIVRVDYAVSYGFAVVFSYQVGENLYRPFYATSACDDISSRILPAKSPHILEVKTTLRGTHGYSETILFDFKNSVPRLISRKIADGRFQ